MLKYMLTLRPNYRGIVVMYAQDKQKLIWFF